MQKLWQINIRQFMKTLIYIDCLERMDFFKRVANAISSDVVFVTNRLSIFVKMRKYNILLLKNKSYSKMLSDKSLKNTLSVAGNYHSLAQAKEISASVFLLLDEITLVDKFDRFIIWNGSTTISKTIGEWAFQAGIKTIFLELSNLPNKLFYDSFGVNAASNLFLNHEILDGFDIKDNVWLEWKKSYFAKSSAPKQASNKHTIRYIQFLDYIGFCFGALKEDFRSPLQIIIQKFKNKKSIVYEKFDLGGDYLFFPLQVSSDTQIILNSDVNNFEVLNMLRVKYEDKLILAKIHPAEENLAFIEEVQGLANKLDIKLVSNDTKELIKNASKVAVINSTVGLEALIYGKEIEVFGRAIYSHFDDSRLKNYICGYLANIEYFSDEEINKEELQRVLN